MQILRTWALVAGAAASLGAQRENVRLDRDVTFLAETGEEGTTRVGILHMANDHFPAIDAEYCLAEGGNVTRVGGRVKYASVETTEKIPRAIELTARGPAGHGSIPLENDALTHLTQAVAAAGTSVPPVSLNETTAAYFKRLASISTPEEAERYRAVLSPDPKVSGPADAWFRKQEPIHASMIRSEAITLPTLLTGATDMAYLRAKGMQCYGIGPALDVEDQTKGFGAHSDQERILETEFQRYARFYYDIVQDVARSRS